MLEIGCGFCTIPVLWYHRLEFLSSCYHLAGLIVSLETAQHVLEMFRRGLAEDSPRRLLARLARRLVKILADARKLNLPQK